MKTNTCYEEMAEACRVWQTANNRRSERMVANMTIPEMNTACSLRHIEVLAAHGAEVKGPNGRQKLDAEFFRYAMNECAEKGFNAVCYELFLPDITDPLLISIHRDGRVNTGSEKNVIMSLDC